MKPIRIGIFYKDFEAPGGFPREYRTFASTLCALGEEVIVYTYAGAHPLESCDRLTTKRFTPPKKSSFRLPRDLKREIMNNDENLDILEIGGCYVPENYMVSLLAKKAGTPYVMALFGQLAPKVIAHRKSIRKRIFNWLFIRKALRNAKGVHCLSPFEERLIRKLTTLPVIRAGFGAFSCDIPANYKRNYWDSRLKLSDNRIILLFLGRLDIYWKGLFELIDAFKIVVETTPDARLILVGPDETNSIEKLKSRVASLGLNDSVIFIDPIFSDDKFSALASADLFVSPSNVDMIPRTVREALLVGTPVLVSDETSTSDIVLKYGAGDRCDVDSQDIARKILALIGNRKRLYTMRSNAVQAANDGFNWHVEANSLRTGYRNLLGISIE